MSRREIIYTLDYLFSGVGRHLTNVRRAFREFDITGPEYYLLHLLAVQGPLNITRIAHDLALTQATASNVVNAARRRGLVTKSKDPEDGRVTRVSLTGDGEDILSYVREKRLERLESVLAVLSTDELEELARMFSRMKGGMAATEGAADDRLDGSSLREGS